MQVQVLGLFVVACTYPLLILASSGDRSKAFQDCLVDCQCSSSLPLILRITLWTCKDDCDYRCCHAVTDAAEAMILAQKGATMVRIEQFYGKWAFWRFLGIQEPASMLFSLLNLWFHVKGLMYLRRRVPTTHPMRPYYVSWSLISINAWIWSAVFHTRDKPITEKLDYFSAGLSILFGLYIAVIRLFHLYPNPPGPGSRDPRIRSILRHFWAALCTAAYLRHISYLSLAPRFDYGYNILANLMVGVIHNILWIFFSIPATPFKRFPFTASSNAKQWVSKPLWCVILMMAATSLELFDFPPWYRIIDAHSLWHLATAPIGRMWYNFLVEDARGEGWVSHKLQ